MVYIPLAYFLKQINNIISKWENPNYFYPDSDQNDSKKLTGSKLDPDTSFDCLF